MAVGLLPRVVFFTLDGKRVVEEFLQFQYVFLVVHFHIMLANYSAINPIFPVCVCDRMLCRACEYCRSGGVGKVRGGGGDVAIGCLVLIWFGGILFQVHLVVLYFFSCVFE